MSDYSVEPIETLDQWNAVGACCCAMPSCPVPTMDCESVTGTGEPAGVFDPSDTEWIIYPSRRRDVTFITNAEIIENHFVVGDYVSASGTGSFLKRTILTYEASRGGNPTVEYVVGNGCAVSSTSTVLSYEGGGSTSVTNYNAWSIQRFPGPEIQSGIDVESEGSATSEHVGGQDNGAGGVYSAETFRRTINWTLYDNCHSFTAGVCDGYPIVTNTTTVTYSTSPFIELITGYSTVTTGDWEYLNGHTYAEWVELARAEMSAAINFDDESCVFATNCTASMSKKPTPPLRSYYADVQIRKARFRFQIPAQIELDPEPPHAEISRWTGTIYQFTYDVLTTPDGWFEGWGGADRSYLEDQTLEWTGPGTGPEDDPSWFTDWVEIDPPSEPGTREIVNIRYACYPNSPYGYKPQTMGTGVDLSEDSPLLGTFTTDRHSIHHTTLL